MSSKSQGRRTTRDPWDVQRALTTDTWSPVWIGNWKLWPGKHQWLENLPLVENPSLLDGNPQSIWIDLWWNSPTSWDCDNKMMIIGNSKKSWMMKKVITKNSQIYPNFMYYDNPQSSGLKKKDFFAQPEITRSTATINDQHLENSMTVSAVRAWCHPQPTRRPGREELVGSVTESIKIHWCFMMMF